jgi:hypothetical protein
VVDITTRRVCDRLMNDHVARLRMMEFTPVKEAMMIIVRRAKEEMPPLAAMNRDGRRCADDPLEVPVAQLSLIEDPGLREALKQFRGAATNATSLWFASANSLEAAESAKSHGWGVSDEKVSAHYMADKGEAAVEAILRAYVQLSRKLEELVS